MLEKMKKDGHKRQAEISKEDLRVSSLNAPRVSF